ncbi:MAG: glycosyl hydrolase [Verrucomicrobiota bacterium]
MNRRIIVSTVLAGLLVAAGSIAGERKPAPAGNLALAQAFQTPPENTRPRCYWYWMDGCFSKEGITHDLEAMRRVGIGESYIGIMGGVSGSPIRAGTKALTEEWWGYLEHAVREGGRIGVDIGLFNSPGWSQSGGPWLKPQQAMRYVVLPETRLRGPQHFVGKLSVPDGFFQDVAVLAFPAPVGESDTAAAHGAKITRTPKVVTFEMPAPFTARSVTIHPIKQGKAACELQASDDGQQFRTLREFTIDRHQLAINVGPVPLAPVVVTIPATTAKYFRLSLSAACELGAIDLSAAARVESFAEKSLQKVFQENQPPFDFYTWPRQPEPDQPGLTIQPDAVRNLSAQLASDGTLTWDVPAGEWIVLRAGMAPTGTKNSPAPPEATGPEVDKMSRPALKSHFEAYVGKLFKRMPAADRKAWKHVVADSYETGPQNWTDDFAPSFRTRYGYDPLPFLPVMTGRIVGSAQESDRFLWDLRRLVADRIARDYVGGLRDLCHEQGMKMWLENYGHWGFPAEFLQYGGACDEISGEFWALNAPLSGLGSVEVRCAASAAHIYGKPVVWSEAFTGGPSFLATPRDLKARGDWAFCEGINQFLLHVYIHQPDDDRHPGVNAGFGTEFNRQNTWFDYAKPWVDYQRRCSVLLQAGRPVADIAYFISEDTPKMTGLRQPPLPAGYDYDYINAEVLLNRAKVKEGRLVLPDDVSYGVLALPPSETMRPEVLKQIARFVDQGLPVFGPLPVRSPSLQDYPACDAEVAKLAAALKDRIPNGNDLRPALKAPPDVLCPGGILWKHRQDADADIYFVSNQGSQERAETLSFRVSGRRPELWHPETGKIRDLPEFSEENGRTKVPLRLGPTESYFVVFSQKNRIQNSEVSIGKAKKNFPDFKPVTEFTGAWAVTFDPKWGGPAKPIPFEALTDWSQNAEPGVKYYSGAATYRKTFEWTNFQSAFYLDLGRVEALARVELNGQDLGIAWKPPYRMDITKALKPGTNELAVTVVNTWNNRLVGDEQPGVTNRLTFRTQNTKQPSAPLQPSGLLGPVRVMAEE